MLHRETPSYLRLYSKQASGSLWNLSFSLSGNGINADRTALSPVTLVHVAGGRYNAGGQNNWNAQNKPSKQRKRPAVWTVKDRKLSLQLHPDSDYITQRGG